MRCNDFLLYEKNNHVATITMNRPRLLNSITGNEVKCFESICERINNDQDVRCVVLTGAGTAFCAGGNVRDMLNKSGLAEGTAYQIQNKYRNSIHKITLSLYRIHVPLIAAVNGPAYGAGCDIACMCDIRIISERAVFSESFVKLGLISGDGGSWFLPRIIGMARAAEMTFTAKPITAQTALDWKLASYMTEHEQLLPTAQKLANDIAQNPGTALRMSKRLLREGQRQELESFLEVTAAYQAIAHHTDEHSKAVENFFKEKN